MFTTTTYMLLKLLTPQLTPLLNFILTLILTRNLQRSSYKLEINRIWGLGPLKMKICDGIYLAWFEYNLNISWLKFLVSLEWFDLQKALIIASKVGQDIYNRKGMILDLVMFWWFFAWVRIFDERSIWAKFRFCFSLKSF